MRTPTYGEDAMIHALDDDLSDIVIKAKRLLGPRHPFVQEAESRLKVLRDEIVKAALAEPEKKKSLLTP